MINKGIYRGSSAGQAHECELTIDGDNLNIYVKDPGVGLVIWHLARLSSCGFREGMLVAKYGSQEQELECSGPVARAIHDRWSGKTVPTKAEERGSSRVIAVL